MKLLGAKIQLFFENNRLYENLMFFVILPSQKKKDEFCYSHGGFMWPVPKNKG